MKSELIVFEDVNVLEAISQLDRGGYGVLFVLDRQNRMLGIITDGDIRRAILRNVDMSSPVSEIMNKDFKYWSPTSSKEEAIKYLRKIKRRHLPVLDSEKRLIEVILLDDINFVQYDNPVVLMAGGFGSRLSPLTDDCPKPLLKVGDKPILETIIENFIEFGFRRFYLSVNYKAEMIKEYFGDGTRLGVSISYLHEDKKLGTAGALGLLPEDQTKPVIVMNGDLLTKVNFQQLLEFHSEHNVMATMCVREYTFQVPYGVVKLGKHRIFSIDEKPVQHFFVNAGIYVLEPEALKVIPKDTYFDMPLLFEKLMEQGHEAAAFPVREYWLDVGHKSDFDKANGEFADVFK